ncbi:MAG: YggS family pyridoxal phosphate-dependent enzyme [Gammaproteobacteria bacterium]
MKKINNSYEAVKDDIAAAERQFGRPPGQIRLIAVGKTRTVAELQQLADCGQTEFGENYLQEAEPKIAALAGRQLCWHFIGPVQSNKAAAIARLFDWVHSVDRLKIAQRLSQARLPGQSDLNICLQVNISGEGSKSGVDAGALETLAAATTKLPGLRLRGLMSLPAPATDMTAQRQAFARVRELYEQLRTAGHDLDTLSMGTTGDMSAAIAEGATLIRIGTALFGPRR